MRARSWFQAMAILAFAGCGGGGSDTTTGPTTPTGGGSTVSVGNNFYSPATLSVATGTTVTWQWADGDVQHTVTFNDNAPGSGAQSSGSFQRTFSVAGTYPYFCSIHGAAVMSGSVTVSDGGASSGGSGGSGGGGGYAGM